MAVDNNTPLPGSPLNVSNPVPPTVQVPPPGVRVAANGDVLNSNERVVSPAEAAKLREAAANAGAQDPNEKKAAQAQQPSEPETPSLRNMLGRVRQAIQNAQDKAAEKEREANAQYVAQNSEGRGMFDPVDANGKPVHTLGDNNRTVADSSTAESQSFAPLHAVQDAMKHVQSGLVDELHAHLPQQDPAPIRDAEVKVVDHSHSENVASVQQDTRTAHEAATVAATPTHAEFHPLDAVSAAFNHVKEGVAEHLAQHPSSTPEQVAQPIAQADIKVSTLEAGAPVREASVAEVHQQGAPEQVAQPITQADIKVSPIEGGAPIRDAVVAEVTHPGQPEQVAQPIAQADIKVSPLEKGEQVREAVAELHPGTGPEQVAQPVTQPDIKVSALEAGAAMHEASGMEPHRPGTPEQVAQPIAQPDIKVSALEVGPALSTEHSSQTLMHGPLGAVQEMVAATGKDASSSVDHSVNKPAESTIGLASPSHAALQGIHAVDAQGINMAAQAALEATRQHAGAPVASPQIHVAELNTASHMQHGHTAPVAQHHGTPDTTHVADARKTPEVQTAAPQSAPVHHDSTHLAGVDAAAAGAMANAARTAAQEKEAAVKSSFASAEKPHFSKAGDIDKEASANLGMLVSTATGEKGRSEQQSPHAYAGKVTSFASDHQARTEVQTALEEHWKKAGVPAHEAQTSVAAIAPKLEQHLDKTAHPEAKLAYYAKGDVAVAIEHPSHQTGEKPTASVSMATLHDVHKHGMPHEAIATVQANLGKEADGLSKLDLMEKFTPQVVRAIGQEGYPHAEVADTKYHLEAGMRNAGAKSPEVSQTDALQALGVVATDSSPKVQAVDRSTGQSYQFTTEQLQQSLGFANEQAHQSQASAPVPQQVAQLEHGRAEFSHH
jgi:hypothetical protein